MSIPAHATMTQAEYEERLAVLQAVYGMTEEEALAALADVTIEDHPPEEPADPAGPDVLP